VSASVIVLRYRPSPEQPNTLGFEVDRTGQLKPAFSFLEPCLKFRPGLVVLVSLLCMIVSMIGAAVLIQIGFVAQNPHTSTWLYTLLGVFLALVLFFLFIISIHQQHDRAYFFKVPLVPLIPSICIFVTIILMTNLDELTWARYFVWMAVGLTIYFSYGIWHSKERSKNSRYVTNMGVTAIRQPPTTIQLQSTFIQNAPTLHPEVMSPSGTMTAEEFFKSQVLMPELPPDYREVDDCEEEQRTYFGAQRPTKRRR